MAPVFYIYHTKQCSFLTRSAGQNKPFNFFQNSLPIVVFLKMTKKVNSKAKEKKIERKLMEMKMNAG